MILLAECYIRLSFTARTMMIAIDPVLKLGVVPLNPV